MVHSPTELSSNTVYQVSKLKPFKQILTTRKLIKDFECHTKIKVAPRSNSLGANNLKSVAFYTFVTANFEGDYFKS